MMKKMSSDTGKILKKSLLGSSLANEKDAMMGLLNKFFNKSDEDEDEDEDDMEDMEDMDYNKGMSDEDEDEDYSSDYEKDADEEKEKKLPKGKRKDLSIMYLTKKMGKNKK